MRALLLLVILVLTIISSVQASSSSLLRGSDDAHVDDVVKLMRELITPSSPSPSKQTVNGTLPKYSCLADGTG